MFLSFFMPNKKKKRKKKKLTPQEKEARFVKIGSRLCVIFVIVFAVFYSAFTVFGGTGDEGSAQKLDFDAIYKTCDESLIITDDINVKYKDAMIDKIKTSQLDIINNDNPTYEKFDQESISIGSDISFTSREIALLYTYTFSTNPDPYDMVLRQYTVTQHDDSITVYSVATLSLYKLFTKHVKALYDDETIDKLPKKIFVVNTSTYKDGVWTFSNVLYNNMTPEQSETMSSYIAQTTPNINLDRYVPKLVLTYLTVLSERTNTTLTYVDNGITLTKTSQ